MNETRASLVTMTLCLVATLLSTGPLATLLAVLTLVSAAAVMIAERRGPRPLPVVVRRGLPGQDSGRPRPPC